MITAIVLINVQRGKVNLIANKLAEAEAITEVFSVGGRYDLVALIRVSTNEQLADLINVTLADYTEITKTESLIAFKAFSKHDIEAMFSIGLE